MKQKYIIGDVVMYDNKIMVIDDSAVSVPRVAL